MKVTNRVLWIAGIFWVLAIGISGVWVTDFAIRPGDQGISSSYLPKGILKERTENLPTLVVIVHPHCSCSRASLGELARLVAHTKDLLNVSVLFYQPADKSLEWVKSDLWTQAKQIKTVDVLVVGKEQVDLFGAMTSGQVVLYGANGKFIFKGGITNGRGHEGTNLGGSTIKDYILNGKMPASQAPVFGCALTSKHIELQE